MNVACGQPSSSATNLADDVGIVVDRLLAHQYELRALLLDDLHEEPRDRPGIGAVGRDQDGAVGAHRQAGAQLLLAVAVSDRDEHHFGVASLLP